MVSPVFGYLVLLKSRWMPHFHEIQIHILWRLPVRGAQAQHIAFIGDDIK
jgi:hypothetical protein